MQSKISVVIISMVFFTVCSCKKDFLDRTPDGDLTQEQVFQNATYTEQFLTNCYSHLPKELQLVGVHGDAENNRRGSAARLVPRRQCREDRRSARDRIRGNPDLCRCLSNLLLPATPCAACPCPESGFFPDAMDGDVAYAESARGTGTEHQAPGESP